MATTYTIPNRPINDSMSYNKNVNNRKPHFTPRVLYSLEKTNREGKDGTNREQDNVSIRIQVDIIDVKECLHILKLMKLTCRSFFQKKEI